MFSSSVRLIALQGERRQLALSNPARLSSISYRPPLCPVYLQNVSGVFTLASADRLATNVTVSRDGTFDGTGLVVGRPLSTTAERLHRECPTLRNSSAHRTRALTIQGNLQFNPRSQGEGPFHSGPAATGRIRKMEDWDWLSAAGA